MAVLAKEVEEIPGAENIKIAQYKREQSAPVVKIAVAVGALVAISAVFAGKSGVEDSSSSVVAGVVQAQGVFDKDAAMIPNLAGWHAMQDTDFSADVASWMMGSGATPSGRIEVDMDGALPKATVYCLSHDQDQMKRIVILHRGTKILDSVMPDVVGIVSVPQSSLASINWKTKPISDSDGDAIMLIARKDDKTTATLLFRKAGQMVSGKPETYEAVNLQ
jgi:hypothetical protein